MQDGGTSKPRQIGGFPFTPSQAKIIDFLFTTKDEYHPKILARCIRGKYSTVRRHCYQLWKDGALSRKKVDGLTFYCLSEQVIKTRIPTHNIKFHGITLKYDNPRKLAINQFGRWKKDLYVTYDPYQNITSVTHQVGKTGEWRRVGRVHFQHEGRSLMVYYGGSGRPLSYEEFREVCKWLGREFGCDVFTDPSWRMSQISVGTDIQQVAINRFDGRGYKGSISVKDFLGNVAEFYDKQLDSGEEVYRRGIELNLEESPNPQLTLDAAMAHLQGGLPMVSAANMMLAVSKQIEGLTNMLRPVVEWIQRKGGRG